MVVSAVFEVCSFGGYIMLFRAVFARGVSRIDWRASYEITMSGLAATEPKWEAGRINVLLGEGQTAQVLRNLCHQLYEQPEPKAEWQEVAGSIESLFGVQGTCAPT